MWKLTLLIIFALIVVEACVYKSDECAPYTVQERHIDYEIRLYPSLTWVITTEENRLARIAKYEAFMRLFAYISGKNDRNLTINMTVPVRMKDTPNGEETIHEMSFMVPSELADNAPLPLDKRIVVSREAPVMYAVRSFKGYVWRQATWNEEAEGLKDSVQDDDTVEKEWFYQVEYDAPHDLFDRRNEIWMMKTTAEESNKI